MKEKNKKIILIITCIILVGGLVIYALLGEKDFEYVSYKDFFEKVESGNIDRVIIGDDFVKFNVKNDDKLYYTENPDFERFKETLLLNSVSVTENSAEDTVIFIFDAMFYLIFFGIVIFVTYKIISMNRENFRIIRHTKVKFDDIAGMEDIKKEMMKMVEILKNPNEYRLKGIRQTKGVILEGNPGNGKTLFAKALAEEADVNFIATKGADFQSAMMSVGAKKIKTLFRKARKHKPCIVFIDEFDSIGERRNYAGTGVDKENNRIVTAMLNEMDGFNSEDGILIIAATNSYNSLDQALIRPGRFDLRYNISNPDLDTRIKLIELYTKNKILSEEVKKEQLAETFENLSCSAIETILNEASMFAIVEGQEKITLENIIKSATKTNCNINLKKLRK